MIELRWVKRNNGLTHVVGNESNGKAILAPCKETVLQWRKWVERIVNDDSLSFSYEWVDDPTGDETE